MGVDFISTGLSGLDEILGGGLVRDRMTLVQGNPGTGKTLIGMKFLEEGSRRGEKSLFVHGEESRKDLVVNGEQIGIDLSNMEFLDIGPETGFVERKESYDLVKPEDIGRKIYIDQIKDEIEERDPDRVFIDPVTQLRYGEGSEHQYFTRMVSFVRFLKDNETSVLSSRMMGRVEDTHIESLSDAVIEIEREENGRRIEAVKHRGVGEMSGSHGFSITDDGLEVHPSLVTEEVKHRFKDSYIKTGRERLDEIIGGGLEGGTVNLISGPTGVGKSTIASYFMSNAALDGDAVRGYLFEESKETLFQRSQDIGVPLGEAVETDRLSVKALNPVSFAPEEFNNKVKEDAEENDPDFVVIDGFEGYKLSIHGKTELLRTKIHNLTRFLSNNGVTVVLVDSTRKISGVGTPTSSNLSYLADNIITLSYVEIDGNLERVIGVLKKRIGNFDSSLYQFEITDTGIEIGEPLTGYRGIIEGSPENTVKQSELEQKR